MMQQMLVGYGGGGDFSDIQIKLWGASGSCSYSCGNWDSNQNGAGGGFVHVTLDATAFSSGDILRILVGQGGSRNGGATFGGGAYAQSNGGAGGGGSFVAWNTGGSNPSPFSVSNMLVAAGGGSGGNAPGGPGGNGSGGGNTGAGGGGGSTGGGQGSGGTGGTGGFGGGGSASSGGSFMQGGHGMSCKGSGGGGGYYGGGGGNGDCGACSAGAGGGGSSYVGNSNISTVNSNAQSWGYNQNPVSTADPHWSAGPGSWGVGDYEGNHGHVIVIVDGVTTHYNYTGSDQFHTL